MSIRWAKLSSLAVRRATRSAVFSSLSHPLRDDPLVATSSLDRYGNTVSTTDIYALEKLNDAIASVVRLPDCPLELLKSAVKMDPNFKTAKAMEAYYSTRLSTRESLERALEILKELEVLCSQGALLSRDACIAAAALAALSNDHVKAAQYFESVLSHDIEPYDPVCLRLAVESYSKAGNHRAAYGCVTRSMQHMLDRNVNRGEITAMMASSCAEMGRTIESELYSEQTINYSKGQDIWATLSYVSNYIMIAHNSEIVDFLEKSKAFDSFQGLGLQLCHYYKGLALAQRGNNRGAVAYLADQLQRLYKDTQATFQEPHPDAIHVPTPLITCSRLEEYIQSVCSAVLLCWQISLHTMDYNVRCRWIELLHIFTHLVEMKESSPFALPTSHSNPLLELCATIVFAANANSEFFVEREPIHLLTTDKNVRTSILSKIKAFVFKEKSPVLPSTSIPYDPNNNTFVQLHKSAGALLDQHMQRINSTVLTESSEATSNDIVSNITALDRLFPSLNSLPLAFKLNRIDMCSVSPQQRQETVAVLCKGFRHFVDGNYADAATAINSQYHALTRLGFTSLERYLLDQTVVEAFMCAHDWHNAKTLLNERVGERENDAQAWIRLSLVYSHLNDSNNYRKARYRAWELGIGQGGFGGNV